MRFLIDQPVSSLLAEWLREDGHDAIHVRDRSMSRSSDSEIVALAIAENRIVVTSDLDYSRIVALSRKERPAVILFRAGNITDTEMLMLLQKVLAEVSPDGLPKSFVVVEAFRIRVTTLPLAPE